MCEEEVFYMQAEAEARNGQEKKAKTQAEVDIEKMWTNLYVRHQERLKPCSGRDEMCHSVLNDDWASHPTWASEDSGFVAHRKNIFEESLHRIEEERHDYDFNIEANAKVIQLLEPIGQSLLSMDPIERENFRMPLALGGQSQSIYKRVLKKIYGDKGPEVAADLFKDPGAVLPVVLARLKQKDEEWRFTQVSCPQIFNTHRTDTHFSANGRRFGKHRPKQCT
jgi:histone deacetylase complex regulatory component SIN3